MTEDANPSGGAWQERLRTAALKGVAHEEARDADEEQARLDHDHRRALITAALEETIAPSLREVIEVATEVGLAMNLIVEPPDPSVTLQIKSSTMRYELLDDASLLLVVLLPSGRVDREPVPPDVSADAVKERAAKFVEKHVNETVVQRFIR